MNTIGCNEFLDQLGDWMEGERSAEARSHLRSCTQCRLLVADLEAIEHAAPAIATGDPEPSPRVWLALREQLEKEGLIHEPRHGHSHGLADWVDGIFAMIPRPAFAAAYLAALVAVGVALSGPRTTRENDARWLDRTETSTQTLNAQLDTDEQDTFLTLKGVDPAVTASLHKDLAIVDNYIALCEKSVREDPQDETARDYLYGAYQQKADLLAQMSDRGDDGQ
ncbi:MAG TPA: hypothetical protein VMB02_09900 [Candidatus Aquilonibacter sp.]|nr:hypothetical protein [Candidatus Aquilonibacter sp.]